jgi:energy-coupling factor transporter ATP-binding protein EcfA2
MSINHVEIKDFLVFKGAFSADFCSGVNLLIGGNGTGKTTLMKVLNAALATERDVNLSISMRKKGHQARGYSFIPMRSVSWREIVPPSSGSFPVRYGISVNGTDVSGKLVTTSTHTTDEYVGVNDSNGKEIPIDQIPEKLRILKLHQGDNIMVKSHIYIPEFDLLKVVQFFKNEIGLLINGKSDNHMQWFAENVLSEEQNSYGNLSRLIEDLIMLYCPDSTSRHLFIELFNLASKAQTFFTDKRALEVCENIEKRLAEKGIVFSGVRFSEDLKSFVFDNGVSAMYEASGVRKFGLLWLLIKYQLLEFDGSSVLFWDEPENSLNPELIPALIDTLVEMSRRGVQIFIATHDYNLARYFDIRKDKDLHVMFHNLIKTCNGIEISSASHYLSVTNNLLEKASEELFDAVVDSAMEGTEDET